MAQFTTFVSSGFQIVVGGAAGDDTQFTITGPGGLVQTYTGSGFTYDNGVVTGGTIDSTSLSIDGVPQYSLEGLGLPMWFVGTILFDGDAETVRQFLLEFGDVLVGAAGDDFLNGYNGDDTIIGGDGNDTLVGGAGTDTLDGGDGDDVFLIGAGADHGYLESIHGGAGSDVIRFTSTTPGDQFFPDMGWFPAIGMTGVETIMISDAAGDTSGTTALNVNARFVIGTGLTIVGNDGANFLGGTINADSLAGNGGDDRLSGGSGNDMLDGGAGTDTVINFGAPGPVTVDLAGGFALDGDGGIDALINIENAEGSDNDDTLIGDGGANVLSGGAGADTLNGASGNDTLYGLEGDDILDGGVGHDAMYGGAGDDTYYFDFGGDAAIEAAGEGTDTVISSIGIDLSDNVENLVVVATVAGYGGGNALDNIITGSAVGDYLVGYAGNDRLYGGAGYDWLRGYEGDDFLYGEADTDDLFGFTGNDYLSGGEGDDRLDGGTGQDTMAGGAGVDLYIVDDEADWLIENPGEGIDTVESSAGSYQLADHTENLTLVGSAAGGTGNDSANVITGNDGDNFISGRSGDDVLIGGAGNDYIVDDGYGNDQLIGGTGSDFLIGLEGDDVYEPGLGGQDTVYDSAGDDEVRMGPGIAPDQVERVRPDGSNDLVLRIAGTTDSVTLYNWFLDPTFQIERVVFDDGTVWDPATTGDLGQGSNQAPIVASPIADQTAQDEVAFSFTVPQDAFSDPDPEDVLTYWATQANGAALPGWLSFDPLTRTFEGTPPPSAAGAVTVRVTATDGDGLSASDDFDLTVLYDGTMSGTEASENIYGTAGNDVIFGLGGNDGLYAYEGDDTLVGGDGFDSLIGGVGNDVLDGGAGNDGMEGQAGNDTYLFARGSGYDVAWEFLGTAEDMDIVSLSADIAPSDISVEYTPATQPYYNDGGFLLFVNGGAGGTLKLVWSPTTGPEIEIEQVVFADGTIWDEAALVAQAIANGDAPVLAGPLADQAATEDAPFAYSVPADAFEDREIPIGDSLAHSASLADGSALPSWLSFDAGTRTFSGTPANGDVGTISVRVTATDQSGQSASDVFDIAVANTNDAPVLANAIGDQTARDTVAFLYTVPADAFADVDAGDVLSYAASLESGAPLPGWLAFDAAARTFSGTPGVADMGTVGVVVTVTDGAGAQAFDVFAILVGAAPDQTITGTAGNDTLSGASGNDTIDGLGGADIMSGGLGDDIYYVGQSGDAVVENPGAGADTVRSSITYALAPNVENLDLIGTAAINGTGNALDNVLSGNAANNRLSGGAGDDIYIITQSGDSVVENSGAGTDTVQAAISYSLGRYVENLLLTGSGDINGTGNSGANSITGNSGNNTLKGGGGADSLSGGAGSDILTGGSGDDAFYFFEAPGANADHIRDFAWGEQLYLDDLAHPGIGAEGTFAPNDERFFAAPGASSGADATDRVIYDTAAGRLYYDADGSGAGESALIAILDNAFALSATDISVI
jgi:Ca2+-binding RTX toxin-like protein